MPMPSASADGHLHVVHVSAVPDRLEDAVREPERQDVLDRFLPQVVIDAVDLRLGAAPWTARRSARGRSPGRSRTASRRSPGASRWSSFVRPASARLSGDRTEEVRAASRDRTGHLAAPVCAAPIDGQLRLQIGVERRHREVTGEVIETLFDASPLGGLQRLAFGAAHALAHRAAEHVAIDRRCGRRRGWRTRRGR